MSNLAKVFEDIKIQQAYQNAELAPNVIQGKIPPSEIARVTGLELAKKQAAPEIERLRAEYDKLIYTTSAVILVTGDKEKAAAFGKLAKEDEALVVESDELWRRLARQAEDLMGPGRIVNATVCNQIVRGVTQILSRFKLQNVSYPQVPMVYMDAVASTEDDVVSIVKATVKNSTPAPVNLWWLAQDVANRAFAQEFVEEPIAVVAIINEAGDLKVWEDEFLSYCAKVSVNVDDYDSPEEALATAREGIREKLPTKP